MFLQEQSKTPITQEQFNNAFNIIVDFTKLYDRNKDLIDSLLPLDQSFQDSLQSFYSTSYIQDMFRENLTTFEPLVKSFEGASSNYSDYLFSEVDEESDEYYDKDLFVSFAKILEEQNYQSKVIEAINSITSDDGKRDFKLY